MRLKFLGTGSTRALPYWRCDCETCVSDNPKNARLRSAFFIELKNTKILIDFGKDFYHQLIKEHEKVSEYVSQFGNIELAYDGMEVEV